MNDSEYRIPKEEFQRMISEIPGNDRIGAIEKQLQAARATIRAEQKWERARRRAALLSPHAERYTHADGREIVLNQPVTLIGIGGKPRAGKDAAADWLVAAHPFEKTFYSEILHEIGLKQDPWIYVTAGEAQELAIPTDGEFGHFHTYSALWEHFRHDYAELKKIGEIREYLLVLGTEVGRNMIYPEVWVDVMRRKIQAAQAKRQPLVVTGLRYPNEIEAIKLLGGVLVYIERSAESRSKPSTPPSEATTPESTRKAVRIDSGAAEHPAENSCTAEDFDITISNDGSLQDLYRAVEEILK